jgi:hypothetical protein
MVTRMRFIVTLYVHCLSCCKLLTFVQVLKHSILIISVLRQILLQNVANVAETVG